MVREREHKAEFERKLKCIFPLISKVGRTFISR